MAAEAPITRDLAVRNLSVRYGAAEAVRGVDMDVPAGAVVALLGANGAGKSTILRSIAGLTPGAGVISFGGVPIGGMSARQRLRLGIVYVPEGREIVGTLSVGENLVLGGYHVGRAVRDQRRATVLELFPEIANRTDAPAWMLSGGEQQMLAIGRALMAGPRVLLLDEPSLGLAPLLVRRVFERLELVRRQTGMSVVLVEQNFRMTVQLADDVYFLRGGAVVGHQAAAELRAPAARKAAIDVYLGNRTDAAQASAAAHA